MPIDVFKSNVPNIPYSRCIEAEKMNCDFSLCWKVNFAGHYHITNASSTNQFWIKNCLSTNFSHFKIFSPCIGATSNTNLYGSQNDSFLEPEARDCHISNIRVYIMNLLVLQRLFSQFLTLNHHLCCQWLLLWWFFLQKSLMQAERITPIGNKPWTDHHP